MPVSSSHSATARAMCCTPTQSSAPEGWPGWLQQALLQQGGIRCDQRTLMTFGSGAKHGPSSVQVRAGRLTA